MNWKHALAAVVLTVTIIIPVFGCSTAVVTTAAAPVVTRTTAAVIQEKPGNPFSDNRTMPFPFSDNGTRPMGPGGEPGIRPSMPEIDWAAAAAKIGVTVERLKAAVGDLSAGMPDFAAIAAELGVSADVVRQVLGFVNGVPPQGVPPLTTPPGVNSGLEN